MKFILKMRAQLFLEVNIPLIKGSMRLEKRGKATGNLDNR